MKINLSICFFLFVNRYILTMASCTMQIISILFFGDSMLKGVTIHSFTSVVAMGFWGMWQLISSPSKSAFKCFCYSERYSECFGVLGYHTKPHHGRSVESRLSIHYHLLSLHEMHMKYVPYINHRLVKFQRCFSFSFLNIIYLFSSDEFFCLVVV